MGERLMIQKTYKLYINGQFPRTESGRFYKIHDANGDFLANACLASRKDFRNAVVAARKAQESWAGRSAYNIGQIFYRLAETLEGMKEQFATIISKEENVSIDKAQKLFERSVDRVVYFAGWSDKYQQMFSSVNPVSSSHFNFSMHEPSGVVAALGDERMNFLSLVSLICSVVLSGNSLVILAGEKAACSAITLAEAINSSDFPSGVINILTGKQEELVSHATQHMDVNSIVIVGEVDRKKLGTESAVNIKRTYFTNGDILNSEEFENPYEISKFTEVKTTWHPIEQIGGSSPSY